MRNLKKFLALMLAMIMAMSLMITANATSTAEDFADSTGITPEFAEAVDVLSGMRVFSGDNGNFKPAANITRAEMAAVIYRLVSGDVTDAKAGLYSNYSPFKDVTADKWYAGYVGYCWNMGLVKGRDPANTVFDPTGNVTGYEALTMLLRAVGYGKNGEFVGSTWQTNVSTQAQQLGILRDVNTTQYGGTLHLAARRDVIASLTFNVAARVPTVTFNGSSYNPYVGVPVTGAGYQAEHNPTLGWKAFGLTNDTGIVVGNQETGESVTRMSFSLVNPDPVYAYGVENLYGEAYDAAAANAANAEAGERQANAIATFDAKTGLDLFAHKVEIWFDGRNTELKPAYFGQNVSLDWRNSKQNNNLHTYAYFDRATNTDVVKVTTPTDTNAMDVYRGPATPGNNNLYSLAAAAGFVVNANTEVEQNLFFDRFLPVDDHTNVQSGDTKVNVVTKLSPDEATAHPAADFTENLYLMISNSDNKELDVVIALNIQASEITGVDNVNAIKTVTVLEALFGNDPEEFIDEDLNILNATTTPNAATIEQGQLVPGSTTTLGQYEIGVRINGTSDSATALLPYSSIVADDDVADGYKNQKANDYVTYENAWYKLHPVTNTKEGTVVSYNPDTGKVVLQDGTVLDRSILYESVVEGTIPQAATKAEDFYANGTYRFYLTDGGKYLGAERVYGSTFLYGTYMDYQTVTSSSTFEYYLTGVKLDGTVDTVRVSRLTRELNNHDVATDTLAINGTDHLGVPFRDTYGNSSIVPGGDDGTNFINGLGSGVYRGFVVNGQTVDWTFQALDNIGVATGDNQAEATWAAGKGPQNNDNEPEVDFDGIRAGEDGDTGADDVITIGERDVALGATYAGEMKLSNTAEAQELYFTEQTKFIVVSGFGTDSLKPQVFNGIKELLGTSTKVTINLDQTAGDSGQPGILGSTYLRDMTYLTHSPFVYAQNRVLSRQADVIILPSTAIDRDTSSTLRYVGNATRTLVDAGNDATQFTMYDKGVAESVWVKGMIDVDGGNNDDAYEVNHNSHDRFYRLKATGRTAVDGKPIYSVELANVDWTYNIYTASTMNAQTGTFEMFLTDGTSRTVGDRDLRRVDSANITNLNVLNPNPTWPGINSLATLNYAGSLGNYDNNQHGGVQTLYVSVVTDGSVGTSQIYVCYDQTGARTLGAQP